MTVCSSLGLQMDPRFARVLHPVRALRWERGGHDAMQDLGSHAAVSAPGAGRPAPAPPERGTARLRELAAVFLRLGLTAFGGPAAHIAMMEDEAVVRRQWLTRERFLDLLGIVNLLPGPSSSELAIYLGYLRAGWIGLLVGGLCFVFPAALLVTALAWMYTRFGSLPEIAGRLYGVRA